MSQFRFIPLLLFFSTITILAQHNDGYTFLGESSDPKIYQLEQKIQKFEKASSALSSLNTQLTANSKAVFELNTKAQTNLQNNIYKTFFKGSLDIINKVTGPLNSILELANDAILNLVAEPMLTKHQNERTFIKELNNASYYRNTKLRLMYSSLGYLMSLPIHRFDDDAKPLPFTKAWWGLPDNIPDNETKMITKKINIIKNLTDMVYKKTEDELKKVRAERRQIIDMIGEMNTELTQLKEKDAEKKRIEKETNKWISDMRKRRGLYTPEKFKEQPSSTFKLDNDPPEVKQKVEEIIAENMRRLQEEKDIKAELERQKEAQKQKEAEAEVYIDAECTRYVLTRENVDLIARAHPEDIEGTFVLMVDDKEIHRTGKYKKTNSFPFRYSFTKPGVYDIQVHLYLDGNYNDTYTDQWYVEENPLYTANPVFGGKGIIGQAAYDPSKEGTKELKFELAGSCTYWVLYVGGSVYLTGNYKTFTGETVEYKSEPLAPFQAQNAENGLLITQSGTGYHFYQTLKAASSSSNPYIITKMYGADISVIHRFNATWTKVVRGPNITIEYKEIEGGPIKKILLD